MYFFHINLSEFISCFLFCLICIITCVLTSLARYLTKLWQNDALKCIWKTHAWLFKNSKYNFDRWLKALMMLLQFEDWWFIETDNVRTEVNYFIDSSYTAMSRWYSALFAWIHRMDSTMGRLWWDLYLLMN